MTRRLHASNDVDTVRVAMAHVIQLGRNGVALSGPQYGNPVQFLFTIADRDSTTPHIKKVRVVSTIVPFRLSGPLRNYAMDH